LLLTLGTSVGTAADDVSAIFDELTSDANRLKIAVTESDGTTEIKCEIAEWDDASETAYLWVASSGLTLSSSATTTLFIYYDAGHADNTANVGDIGSTAGEGVWDSNFVYVHHGVTASPVDSTSNDNDGTATGATTIAGHIGTAMDFDGVGDFVETAWPSGAPTAGHTIELWIDPDAINVDVPISAWNNQDNFGIYLDNDWYSGSVGSWVNQDSGMTTAGWQQLAMAHPSGTGAQEKWRNGVSTGTVGSYATQWQTPTNSVIAYGRDNRDGLQDWAGAICEVRLSDIQRPDEYMKANYHSTNDGLVSWGTEELEPGFTETITDPVGVTDIVTAVLTGAGVLTQDGYRFYDDDAAVGSETALANEDTNITRGKEAPFRLRIQVDVTGDADASAMTLQYKEVGDGVAEWRDVPL